MDLSTLPHSHQQPCGAAAPGVDRQLLAQRQHALAAAAAQLKAELVGIDDVIGPDNSFAGPKVTTRQNAPDMLCVGLAGHVAEELVFGETGCTTGAEHDHKQVTAEAARYVRHQGFGMRISRTDATVEMDNHINTDVGPSNAAIEELLQAQYRRTQALLAVQGLRVAVRPASAGAEEALVLEPLAERLARFQREGAAR